MSVLVPIKLHYRQSQSALVACTMNLSKVIANQPEAEPLAMQRLRVYTCMMYELLVGTKATNMQQLLAVVARKTCMLSRFCRHAAPCC